MTDGRRPLRVAHLAPTFFAPESVVGGGERYVLYLAQALAAAMPHPWAEFSQTIFSIGSPERRYVAHDLQVQLFPNENTSQNMMSAFSGRFWTALTDFDIVHVHQSLSVFGAYSSVTAKSLRKVLVLTDTGGGNNNIMLSGHGLDLADGVISISRYAHSMVAAKFSGPHEILIGPVDTELFRPRHGQTPDRLSAICVSRILPHKGIDRIIAALPAGLTLRVVGRVYDQQYYQLLKDMSHGKNVQFIHDANDQDLVELYCGSGVFLQGSTTTDCYGNTVHKPELLGLTTLEAMSCGLPAIVSNAGSLPELVPDPAFGRVFVSHGDLVRQLEEYMSGAWPPAGASEAARRHVILNHSFPVIGRRLGDYYSCLYQAAMPRGC